MQIGRTVESFLTFFRDCKTKKQNKYWNIYTKSNESIKQAEGGFTFFKIHFYPCIQIKKKIHMDTVKLNIVRNNPLLYKVCGI